MRRQSPRGSLAASRSAADVPSWGFRWIDWAEARPLLIRLMREAPSAEIIGAVVPVADRDTIVILRRIARTTPDLTAGTQAVIDELTA